MQLIDTHAHLDDAQFEDDLEATLARAREVGIIHVLAIATTAGSSVRTVQIAERSPGVFATVGIQPNHVAEAGPQDWDRIEQLAAAPRVVAIGETGLDRHWDYTPFEQQQEFFTRHLDLARRTELPVVIHCREAEEDVLAALRGQPAEPPLRGVMHSFTGDADTAERCLELGLFISFAGMVTYKKSDPLRAVAGQVPLERLLIETDSPYLSPHPYRGKRNEPARIVHTAACLAEVKGIALDELARQTTANARNLFRLPSAPPET